MDEATKQKILQAYFDKKTTILGAALEADVTVEEARAVIQEELRSRNVNTPKGSSPARIAPAETVQLFLEKYTEYGSIKRAAEECGVSVETARRWLRPTRRETLADTITASPRVEDALVQNALRALARDDQRDAQLADYRGKLAVELYEKASRFWDRAQGLAEQEKVPHQELKAVVTAAHYAVKDAQLLGGQPTERIENMFSELEKLSDEELAQFVGMDVEIPEDRE